ncbi:MAG: MOSC domain-containing protein [Anaerolineae bacterium]|nr:MOSC domain-containing protein [Anaerolineae bacterium]
MHLHLSGLYYYPIKSCAGTSVDRAQTDERGVIGDREYMVVDSDGHFITQREYPGMALIQPQRDDTGILRISAPEISTLTVDPLEGEEHRQITVWRYTGPAIDMGNQAAQWFSDYLGTPARLVRQDHSHKRAVNPQYALSDRDETSFSDAYPFLIISQASLDDLNSRLDSALPMNRFRPNLVVAGSNPFAEDTWTRIRIGSLSLAIVKPCARCVTTTVDQSTGKKGVEPLRTLAKFRQTTATNDVMFGQNVIYADPSSQPRGGMLCIGDPVEVLATKSQ